MRNIFYPLFLALKVFTVKEAQASFSLRPFGSNGNINAPKACKMLLKLKSFPKKKLKFEWSSRYSTTAYTSLKLNPLLLRILLGLAQDLIQ
jgi:hypothetical protein